MPSTSLEESKHRVYSKGHGIPDQFIPIPQVFHITRRCREECVQRGYMWEEHLDLVSDGGGVLP